MSKSQKERSSRQQLESVEEQLDLTREKITSVEAARTGAAVRSGENLARLRKEFDSSREPTATAESAEMVLHKEVDVVTAKVHDLELNDATLRKEFET